MVARLEGVGTCRDHTVQRQNYEEEMIQEQDVGQVETRGNGPTEDAIKAAKAKKT